ncbi:hypothetical protein [Adhaeretor mobilis]|uniref:Uncharacterized protein n=1 Tax=Adhaeretor mobilis TaxID=1930276 RepID=A0A517MS70_9BACT|nr:hypothetical protein [Adhaeretor mobilis]QDS97627.1 hypothetical protein HG15A2_08910 [Adhaeretor mobilis]
MLPYLRDVVQSPQVLAACSFISLLMGQAGSAALAQSEPVRESVYAESGGLEEEFSSALNSAAWDIVESPVFVTDGIELNHPRGIAARDTSISNGTKTPYRDDQIEPAQGFGPALGIGLGTLPFQQALQVQSRGQQNNRGAGVALGLASVPFMIGDTSAGTCFGLRGVVFADLSHPSLTCSRLNISENNSAIPVDRIYYSYRHFENSTRLQFFQFTDIYNVDQHTIGGERTFWDGMASIEMRAPILYRLKSDVISIVDPLVTGKVDLVDGDNREAQIGNLSFITKAVLYEQSNFLLTGGLGVTVPTAEDVSFGLGARTLVDLDPLFPGLVGISQTAFQYQYENDTVYLSPFAAWIFTPSDQQARWFHQGFLQIEVGANPSKLTTTGSTRLDTFLGPIDPGNFAGDNFSQTPGGGPVEVDVFAQTLMRLNLGLGYRVTDRDPRRIVSNVVALLETHYTHTLQDSNVQQIPLEEVFSSGVGTVLGPTSTAGNPLRRADIINVAAGVSADVGPFVITNGVAAPIRSIPYRGFDFEYNCQVQLPF